jgi:flagellar hook-basal body complex protein FliE
MSAAPVVAVLALPPPAPLAAPAPAAPPAAPSTLFADLLSNGLDQVNAKVTDADKLARAFTLDDSIPVHQVTYALEQARLALELMSQVRMRLIDGYQQLMNMQL